jgi:DNA-binding transcriptional regulator LsrR (DeoR family)
MPRLNIYIPEQLQFELNLFRDRMNLSEICTNALWSELRALRTGVSRDQLPGGAEWSRSDAESEIARRYDLRIVRIVPARWMVEGQEPVAKATAELIDSLVRDGMSMAVGGGSQMSATVNQLRPRNARVHLSAIGYGLVDRELPHVHPNSLVTRLSLLYARSSVALVGDKQLHERWPLVAEPTHDGVMRLIVGGCSLWQRDSEFARLLGPEICEVLDEKKVVGDYLGVFLGADGQPVEPYLPSAPVSSLGSAALYAYARRADTLVVLVAADFVKIQPIKKALEAKLCNALILDEETASVLISHMRTGIPA